MSSRSGLNGYVDYCCRLEIKKTSNRNELARYIQLIDQYFLEKSPRIRFFAASFILRGKIANIGRRVGAREGALVGTRNLNLGDHLMFIIIR